MAGLLSDIRLALRRLRASPGFTLFAMVSLAVGIGVTTAIYSAVRTLLWMPLGVPHQRDLVQVADGQTPGPSMSWQDFDVLRREQTTFRNVAAFTRIHTAVSGAAEPRTVDGEAVSGEFFDTLQVRPRLGRLIDPADAVAGTHVVVLSTAFWSNTCAADPAIVGRTLRLGGELFEVVGVVAGDFHGLEQRPVPGSIWIPLSALSSDTGALGSPPWDTLRTERSSSLSVWGRLKPDVPVGRAAAEVSMVARRLEAAQPTAPTPGKLPRQWRLRPAGAALPDSSFVDTIVIAILTAIATLLLIACTNLANLALARGTSRAQEIAVRSALGAGRWRLVREQLVESAIVVVCGSALGLAILARLVAYWTVELPLSFGATTAFAPQVDASVLAACTGAMLIAVLVFGVWPALQSTRSDVRDALGAGHGATPPKWRLHRTIIAWQVCGSVALLLVALLCAKVLMSPDLSGLTARHADLAIAQVDFRSNGKSELQMRRLVAAILDDARTQHGIRSVSASTDLPFGFFGRESAFVTTPDHASAPPESPFWALPTIIATAPAFLSTIGIRLVHGRPFTDDDSAGAPRIVIVSEEFARETFRTTDVVGRAIVIRSPDPSRGRSGPALDSLTIVGVSEDDVPYENGKRRAVIFVPFAQWYQADAPVTFVANPINPRAGVAALRASIRRVDPDLSINAAGTGAVLIEGPLYLLGIIAVMAAALGTLALVLAMAGLFGVLSHVVTKRTREIGIRLAIGAERADVFRLIVRDGLQPVAKGLLLGLGIGLASRIAVKAFVETKVAAVDPWPLLLLPIPFILAALAACYFPAARASRVDPNVALRDL